MAGAGLFKSLDGGRSLRSLAYAPFGVARSRALRAYGPAHLMVDALLVAGAARSRALRACDPGGMGALRSLPVAPEQSYNRRAG